jgi:CheY-like chemotaxis protein
MIRPLIDTHRQFLTVALPSEPLFIDGDLARLTQVVGNVLHNAVKYTPDGGLISIRLECAGNQAVLAVADTGIGIASALLPHVFDSFTQAGGAANGSNHGLGIGLTVARQLIEEHGGCIEANSDGEGRGSEFVVRIPLISTAESPDSPPPTMASQQVTQTRRILLVDDSVDAAESIGILGNLPGNEVCWTLRADSGVRLAGDFRPHLVVLDLGSRDVDGPGVARRVREQAGATQPVIVSVMTRHRPEPDCSRAPQANFDRYVAKPMDGAAWTTLIAALGSGCGFVRPESAVAH